MKKSGRRYAFSLVVVWSVVFLAIDPVCAGEEPAVPTVLEPVHVIAAPII